MASFYGSHFLKPVVISLSSSPLQILSRVISYVLSSMDVIFSEDLLIAGNHCLTELCHCLQNHFALCAQDVGSFVIQQLEDCDSELPSIDHSYSVVNLLLKVHCMALEQRAGVPRR